MHLLRIVGSFLNSLFIAVSLGVLLFASTEENLLDSREDILAVSLFLAFAASCTVLLIIYLKHSQKARLLSVENKQRNTLDSQETDQLQERFSKELQQFSILKLFGYLFGAAHLGLGLYLWINLYLNGQLGRARFDQIESLLPEFISTIVLLNGILAIGYLMIIDQVLKKNY